MNKTVKTLEMLADIQMDIKCHIERLIDEDAYPSEYNRLYAYIDKIQDVKLIVVEDDIS